MGTPLRWGIIGTGKIAAAFARALEHTDSGNLVAVASRTEANAERFGETYGVELQACLVRGPCERPGRRRRLRLDAPPDARGVGDQVRRGR